MVYVWNEWCAYLSDGDAGEYIMVGLGNGMGQAPTSAVGLSCLRHLVAIVMDVGVQGDLMLRIILLFFVCKYSVDFIPPWAGRCSRRS